MNTNFDINNFLRENIKNIKPYSSARDEYTGEASVFLDANENSYGTIGGDKYNRYPDPYQRDLKAVVSKIKNVPMEQMFLSGGGSDEGIDLLYKAFCRPGVDKAIIPSPTYGMYEVSANVNDVQILDINLTDNYQPNVEAIIEAGKQDEVKLVFLCSPNNPTGNLYETERVVKILENFNGIVVVDEAYIDFANQASWSSKLNQYPNLIVLQTFSKAWGMANIRLGMMFASKQIIDVVNKIKLPYNISGMVQNYAIKVLSEKAADKDVMVSKLLSERGRLENVFKSLPYIETVYPTDANFILIKTGDARELYNYLLSKTIVVRDRSKIALCANCIRITVGTEEENTILIDVMKKFE